MTPRQRTPAWIKALQAGMILGLGFWVFSPALHGEWLFDDRDGILYNPILHSPAGLWRIWFAPPGPDYFPLKDTVQWVQWHFWGTSTAGYHLTNVALHLASALLLWRLLARLGVGAAWLGGLLFAVHPVTVESVAWISELKNTLSLPFLLLAMLAYLHYDEHGDRSSYLRAMAAFLASLLSKTSGVMFPVIILLYGWWRHGRMRGTDWRRSAPFFAMALLLGEVTIFFQHAVTPGAEPMTAPAPFDRLLCAGLMIAFSIAKCFWPAHLDIIYFRWNIAAAAPWEIFFWMLLALGLGGLVLRRASWSRHTLFGFLFFLVNLLPVLGFIRMAWMRYSWVADHLIYLPLAGLAGLAAAAVGNLHDRLKQGRFFLSLAVAVTIALLAWQSHAYAKVFKTSIALWEHNVRENPASWAGFNNLGTTLAEEGQPIAAIGEFQKSLGVRPDQAAAYINRGNALVELGDTPGAIQAYEAALALRPDNAAAHNQLGNVLVRSGQLSRAVEQYRLALRTDPDYAQAESNLADAFIQMGRLADAIEAGQRAVQIDPANAQAHYNLGIALGEADRNSEAAAEFATAAGLAPDDAEVHYNWGIALWKEGQISAAFQQFQEAVQLDSHYTAARSAMDRLRNR